jgi:excisionase family DNA binding protein
MGISRSTIYALMRDGSLSSMKIGGSRKIADQQIANYLNSAIEKTYI